MEVTQEAVRDLVRRIGAAEVLTVFVKGADADPAERAAWRLRLDRALDEERSRLEGEDPEQVEPFDEAVSQVQAFAERWDGVLPHETWVCVATAGAVEFEGPLDYPVRSRAQWGTPELGPMLRAIQRRRPVMVVLADVRRARGFRYGPGGLSEEWDLIAHHGLDEMSDRSVSKTAGTTSGVRGETGRDAARRALAVETDRMLKDAVARLANEADSGGVLVGGPTATASAIIASLEANDVACEVLSDVGLEMSDAELARRVREARATLDQRDQRARVGSVVEDRGTTGNGCAGWNDVQRATRASAVDCLFVSRAVLRSGDPALGALIVQVIAEGGAVEEVEGDSADMLDEAGNGLAARLRFRPPSLA